MTLAFEVTDWLGGAKDDTDGTYGALQILAGEGELPLTEVHDSLARATRPSIRVPIIRLAEWLAARWWRLRWEPFDESPSGDWLRAHSLSALGGGIAWPPLQIASDGEFVQLTLRPEPRADVAAIRYLHDVQGLEIPSAEFERAVDRFLDVVESRLATILPAERVLADLREELRAELADPIVARRCRWQARAGIDPGDRPESWADAVDRVARDVGFDAVEDILAALGPSGDATGIRSVADAVSAAAVSVDLGGIPAVAARRPNLAKPWERGASAAVQVRRSLGLPPGPLRDDDLNRLLGARLPIPAVELPAQAVVGGYRRRDGGGTTAVLLRSPRRTSQRFFLARLIGLAADLPRDEQMLPISAAGTAMQKFGRSFAQELLCPWAELDAFTDQHGVSDESIEWAADRYDVSPMLITSVLVNRRKLDRARLNRFDRAL